MLSISPRSVKTSLNRRTMLQHLRSARITGSQDDPALLFFNHFFDQDIRALEQADATVRLVIVDAPSAFRFTQTLFPRGVVELTDRYQDAPASARFAHRAASEAMLREAIATLGVRAIGATNDSFYWYRECLVVAEELGLKKIVIDKEGTISPHDWDNQADVIRRNAPFGSDRIYVWSDRQRRFWSSIGAPPDAIVVTGQPRSDLLFDEVATRLPADVPSDRPLATFFAFAEDAYVPLDVPGRESTWSRLRDQSVDAIAEAAALCPGAFLVFKLHPQDPAEDYYRDRLGALANVQVRRDSSSAYALLVHSRTIVAFQTTAVIEAGPLGKAVLYPAWDPRESELEDDLLPLRSMSHVFSMSTPAELTRALVDALSGGEGSVHVQPAPNEYLEGCDGGVSARILADVARLIT